TGAGSSMTAITASSATSDTLQAELEFHRGMDIFWIADQHHRPHQFAAMDQRIAIEVLVWIALEHRIGRKVKLRDQRLVSRRRDQIMDVLTYSVGIMTRHHRFEFVIPGSVDGQLGSIAVPSEVGK